MKTFQITGGDLALDGGSLSMVTGPNKLVQDLALAIRERLGNDRFHPRWGSLFDTYIGEPMSPSLEVLLRSEMERVIGNYMILQRALIEREANRGKKPRYGAGEVIRRLARIDMKIEMDTVKFVVIIDTMSGEEIDIAGALSLTTGFVEV
jgi:hypothetical protein